MLGETAKFSSFVVTGRSWPFIRNAHEKTGFFTPGHENMW
ncbi:Uncharacterized protein dnm_095550 [Desulfonema magnum]|uniref:Uncharacterized protein n=1 Tax=Desulfonema magnum TaxID=45655 RepID=A0A975BX63_9BACT|nr:Uncharacterized protein dnm_095550 [Desulfonema magnum]